MNIKRKILKRIIRPACNQKRVRRHIIAELLQHHSDELINEVLENRKDTLLPLLAEVMHRQTMTDQELNLLAYAANAALHYSQEGEDIVLARLLGERKNGFFVDVGAHHPMRFSNTYSLYRQGWRGINIDAAPGSMAAFALWRPRDINIEAAVSDSTEPLDFHIFAEPALSTFDAALAESYIQAGWNRLTVQRVIPKQLSQILEENLPPDTEIDVMSIDVEGGEMGVLKSNDWEKYAPRYLVLELLDVPLAKIMDAPAVTFLREKGYAPISKLSQSLVLQKP